ncbi:hypothetical protein ACIQTZ_20550 [Paenarthrobacter sp. NPDC090520]|uniref:hypothetical protein n=1 Tax=Paenarthrobacter sp. NPDC090520 TaxID=3364382 RepID=UPI00381BB46E
MNEMNAVVAKVQSSAVEITGALAVFEEALLSKAEEMGLPSTEVVHPVDKRVQVLQNMDGAMSALPAEKRAESMYLSKFMMAISAGLFDAALNYLWDETISELRKRIIDYDLAYFFDLAVDAPEKRKELKDAEDLTKITDDELIRAAARIGFISSIGQQQLDLVRYMRNHASAAHPNQHELQPYALLGYMETCIREVITLPQSPTMVATSRLLRNVKTATVTKEDAAGFAGLFEGLRRDQTDVLANGLFGIYVAKDSTPVIRDNVRLLLPHLWPTLAEEVKSSFGTRYARFKANLDTDQASFAREFLEAVEGESYLPEDIRSGDIDALLDRLRRTHHGLDNFYNEPPIARELEGYIGSMPIPTGVRFKYIEVLVEVFLGRHSGISWAADPIYERLLSTVNPEEASLALLYLTGADVAALLSYKKPQEQFNRLIEIMKPKLVGRPANALMKGIVGFNGPTASIFKDASIKKLRDALAASL